AGDGAGARRGRGRAGGERGRDPVGFGEHAAARAAPGAAAAQARREAGAAVRGGDARHRRGVHQRAAGAASCVPVIFSFPGSAWERAALQALPAWGRAPARNLIYFRGRPARQSLAARAFPGRAWERETAMLTGKMVRVRYARERILPYYL